jgi:His/Glu/Gln/Arg/opine family amino acid ABC transporter permease subunit
MGISDILILYRQAFLRGLGVTLELAAITWTAGLLLGLTMGTLAHRSPKTFGRFVRVLAFLLSGIPFLVLLYWAHYPFQELIGAVIDPFFTASAVLTILNTVAVAELCRSALDDFPSEYVMVAQVCGLSRRQTTRYIQFPLLFRQLLPGLLTLQVTMLQMTLFASLISVGELFRVAQEIDSKIHKEIEIYSALALFFLAICLPLNGLALWLRRRLTRNVSER